jgi:hypothetical protein
MAMPDTRFRHQFAALGGVRLITRSGTQLQRQRSIEHTRVVLSQVAADIMANQAALHESATKAD